ncbi:hypothetical protein BAJUN_01420 [Bajunvirus bajun]|uniref:Uncharacterized protein n=1 Tax=Brevundimonas phage vB_BgoS-Bajun TaxID=2948594 RepID=A0A9E7N7A2_9CAUD|nr:hypothetical protein BAJUN_01420 [Brevundimonas phage vB_BgoS-Bajun]
MSDDPHRDDVRRLANLLFCRVAAKRISEGCALRSLEGYVTAPAFALKDRRALIEDAYAVHHLPSPYEVPA